jgi:hypothetical protein
MNMKDDCEKAIRHLCWEWAKARGITPAPDYHASFSDFKTWLGEKGYSHYLNFRSKVGSLYDAELWFDEEMKQTWRR